MAGPLTWQSVAAPNFSSSIEGYLGAGKLINQGFDGLADALGKYGTVLGNQNAAKLAMNAASYADPKAAAAALADGSIYKGIDTSFLTPDAVKNFGETRVHDLLNNALTGAQTNQANAGAGLTNAESNKITKMLPGDLLQQIAARNLTGAQANQANAGAGLSNANANQITKLLTGTIAQQGAQLGLTGAQAGEINQRVSQGKTTFDLGQSSLAGEGRAMHTGSLEDGIAAIKTDPNIPDAAKPAAVEQLMRQAGIYGAQGGTGVGVGANSVGAPIGVSGSATTAPVSLGADWNKNIKFGEDSSGPVSGDKLNDPMKRGLSTLSQLVPGGLTINSTDGGVHAKGSQHYDENAADLSISGKSKDEIADMILKGRQAGFTGFGIGKTHLHLDMRPGGVQVFEDGNGANHDPVAGRSKDEWQSVLSSTNPLDLGQAKLNSVQGDYFGTLSKYNEAAKGAQQYIAGLNADGTQGRYDESTQDTSSGPDEIAKRLTATGSKVTSKDANGNSVETTTGGGGAFAGVQNVGAVSQALKIIKARADQQKVPLTWAQAGDVLENTMHLRGTINGVQTIDSDKNGALGAFLPGNLDAVDSELERIGSNGPEGRYALNQENVKAKSQLATAQVMKANAEKAYNDLMNEYRAAQRDPNINPAEIKRYEDNYVRQKTMFDQAVNGIGTRSPKLNPSKAAQKQADDFVQSVSNGANAVKDFFAGSPPPKPASSTGFFGTSLR